MNVKNKTLRLKTVKNRAKITSDYTRIGFYSIDDIIKKLKKEKGRNKYFYMKKGAKIKTSSQKNNIFINNFHKHKNVCKCDICGLTAHYFSLEKSPDNTKNLYHFNLYTILTHNNTEIYFNIDHIKPRAKGGSNTLDNMQLTCEKCNSDKADTFNKWVELRNILLKKIKNILRNN